MDLIQLEPQRDHLQTMVLDDALKHLESEPDDSKGLRIALLLAVDLLQAEDDIVAVDFCNAMLGAFPPLSEHFTSDHTHPLCGGYNALRAKDDNDNLKILFPTEYIEYVGGSFLDRGRTDQEKDDE